jgi:GWxTD domain-containing protein
METAGKCSIKVVVFAAVFSLYACYSNKNIGDQNIVDIYRSSALSLHPQFTLLHVNDSVSLLYYKIDESELLYERRTLSDSFSAGVKIHCSVTLNYESPIIIDSTSSVLNFRSFINIKKEFATGSVPLKLNRGGKYLVSISTNDLFSKRYNISYIEANKTDFLGKQNFLVLHHSDNSVLFSPWLDTASQVSIQYVQPVNKLCVSFYQNRFPTAAPPFTSVLYYLLWLKSDSDFSINKVNGVFDLNLKSKGLYHITIDSNQSEGLTLFHYDDNYPGITKAYQMVTPLQYILSNDEFEKIKQSTNPKKEVDNFWLNVSWGNKERAKEIIRSYYTRVQDANNYFSSYEEGWKTDRGMMYLVLGPPKTIYRSSDNEVWTYGEERNYMISFTFIKLDNPFCDNDYSLQRAETYRNLWFDAVDLWRQGKIY